MEGSDFPTEEARLHHDEETQKMSMANVQARVYTVGFRHGKLKTLPATYQFPFITPQQLVQNWLVGDWEADLLMEKYMQKSNRKKELRWKTV